MTNKQRTLAAYYSISADFINGVIDSGDRVDLHHIEPTLKYTDPERYNQFLSADVVPIAQKEHLRLHKKGVKHDKAYNKKISTTIKDTYATRRLADCIVKMTNIKTGEIDYAINGKAAANFIGCSKQLVYQVLSDKPQFQYFHTAKGWKLELVDLSEITNK